jgi:hypothetical protein
MTNEKYYVIEKAILEKLLQDMIDKRKIEWQDNYIKWVDGNIFALETVKDFCKPYNKIK